MLKIFAKAAELVGYVKQGAKKNIIHVFEIACCKKPWGDILEKEARTKQ